MRSLCVPLAFVLLSTALISATEPCPARPATTRIHASQSVHSIGVQGQRRSAHAKATAPSALPAWKPDENLVSQLGSRVKIYGITFQPPQGYVLVQRNLDLGSKHLRVWLWQGDPRPDGSVPNFHVVVRNLPAGPTSIATTEQLLKSSLMDAAHIFSKVTSTYTHSRMERGTVNGIPFVRVYYKFPLPNAHNALHGLAYITIVHNKALIFASLDIEPYWTDTVFLGEAAALTARRG